MTRLLQIQSSPAGAYSKTNALVNRFVDAWQAKSADTDIVVRDVGSTPPPHIDGMMMGSYFTPEDDRTDDQRAAIAQSDELLDELMASDVIVIGAPMYNFSIASSLKAWIDHIVRVGRAFQYTATGPEGLIKGKKVYIITASGGNYAKDSPVHALDHQTPYLKTILGFVGIVDVTFVHAFGVAGGEEGLRAAEAEIDGLIEGHFSAEAA
jgi:FMN-dependent NADH-azoreductase